MNILIVDDDPGSRLLLKDIMAPHGNITMAKDGREGVDLFKRALAVRETFDLVLLDIQMPLME